MTKTKFMKGLLGATALTVLSTGTAFAQNNFTPAETPVSNTFTLDYNVGLVGQTQIENSGSPTVFVVDRLVNVTVASTGGGDNLAPGTENAEVTFTVQNDGNDTHAYLLGLENEASPDFVLEAPTSTNVISYSGDEDGDGLISAAEAVVKVYDPADDTTWPVLAPDGNITVTVQQDIPTSANDGEEAEVYLYADTRDETDPSGTAIVGDTDTINTTSVAENVLADLNGPASDGANDGLADGAHSATGVYNVETAEVTATKDVFVLSDGPSPALYDCAAIPGAYTPPAPSTDAPVGPVTNNGYNRPGACVEYFITVRNSGTADAVSIDLVDNLPNNLIFESMAVVGDLTGGTLSTIAPNLECDGTASTCNATLTGATLAGTANPLTPTEGHFVIRATIK
jgi:uncharacterized repeat protein (TIGR01451 family)